MPYFETQHTRYYYEITDSDSESADTLVLLHGFTGSSASWFRNREVLARHCRLIIIDLPGHGKTQSQNFQMANVAQDLASLMEQIASSPVHLLGYSMGGRLALYLAVFHPSQIKSLILESASPGLETPEERQTRREQDEKLAQKIEQEGIPAFADYWTQIPLFASHQQLPADIQQTLKQQRLQNSAGGLAASLRGMGTGMQPSLWWFLPTLKSSVLLIIGQLDEKFTRINQRMVERLPDKTRLHQIANSGHTPHLEQPDAFNRVVIDWCQ